MRLNITIVFLMCLLGFACRDWEYFNWNALAYRLYWGIQHNFWPCPCKDEREKGLKSLKRYPCVGKSSEEIIQLIGTPDHVKGLFPDKNGNDIESIPKDIWSYEQLKIVLCISNNKCFDAFPMHTYWH